MLANKLLHKFTLVPYDEDMYDEFAAGSLILINWRTADALVEATTHALRDGSLKRVGILFTLDTEALASRENLLKVNLSLRSMWGGGLILIKPKTSRCKCHIEIYQRLPLKSTRPSTSSRCSSSTTGGQPASQAAQPQAAPA